FFPFAIQIEANWVITSSATGNSFVAVDDISLSVECFDKDGQLSPVHNWTSMTVDSCGSTGTQVIRAERCLQRGHRQDGQLSPVHNWTSMTVDSCGSTGTQVIRAERCLQRGHRQGPYQYLIVDHREQIWTVPETLPYRWLY
ncbi:unnamed protein product, partial [Strongylus vulgaris]